MTQLRSEAVERFPEGASQEVKRKFAKTLVEALDELKVKPGDDFLVVTVAEEERVRSEYQDLEEALAEEQSLGEDYRWLVEKVEDFGRGIVTAEELLDEVRRR